MNVVRSPVSLLMRHFLSSCRQLCLMDFSSVVNQLALLASSLAGMVGAAVSMLSVIHRKKFFKAWSELDVVFGT